MQEIRKNPDQDRSQILEKLGNTSTRQFFLDRKALEKAGFKFKWSRKESRFTVLEDPFVEQVELQMSEALALGCAIDALARGGERELAWEAKKGLERLLSATRPPAEERQVVQRLLDNVTDRTPRREVVGGAPLELVMDAARSMVRQCELRIKYQKPRKTDDSKDIPSSKPVEARPIHVHSIFMAGHTGTAIYVDAYCPKSSAYRVFRLSRVMEWEIGDPFERHADYSFSDRYKDVFQVHGAGESPQEVVLHIEPPMAAYVTEKKWHPSMDVRPFPDGSAEVSMKVTHPEEVLWWSFLWEGHVFALKPPRLVDKAREAVERLNQNYSKVLKTR